MCVAREYTKPLSEIIICLNFNKTLKTDALYKELRYLNDLRIFHSILIAMCPSTFRICVN